MNISYRNEDGRNFLVIKPPEPESRDFGLKMLERRGIPGFLTLRSSSLNGKIQLLYDITSVQPLERIHERKKMTGTDLELLISGIIQSQKNAARFMVEDAGIVYSPDLIFIEPDNHRPFFLYIPPSCRQEEHGRGLELLAAFVIKNLDHSDPEAIRLGYGFYSCSQDLNFSFQDLDRKLLRKPEVLCRTPDLSDKKSMDPKAFSFAGGAGCRMKKTPDDETVNENREPNAADGPGRQSKSPKARPEISRKTMPETGRKARLEISRKTMPETSRKVRLETGRKTMPETSWKISRKTMPETSRRSSLKRYPFGRQRSRTAEQLPLYPGRFILLAAIMAAACTLIIFVCNFDLTQAGGLGFLFIAVFWLIYSTISDRKKKNKNYWADEEAEEEDRLLEALLNEVYSDETADTKEDGFSTSDGLFSDPMEEGGATQILSEEKKRKEFELSSLEPEKYPDIPINQDRTVVGKKSEQVDIRIPNVDSISRIHAQIMREDDRLWVEDLNSTNGTYLNERRLESAKKAELKEKDIVSFASASYKVTLNDPGDAGSSPFR